MAGIDLGFVCYARSRMNRRRTVKVGERTNDDQQNPGYEKKGS